MAEKQVPKYYWDSDREVYVLLETITYYSKRYNKHVTCLKDKTSDGATYAVDIKSASWWFHDQLCDTGVWDDGTPCTNAQASTVLTSVLWSEGCYFRSLYWWPTTWLFGGGKARKNGMF